jgi:4-hydroxy-3-methylbut-2-enyl diphosphate reductase IspH
MRVESAEDLELEWFNAVDFVGLIAGSSTLDAAIDDVHRALEQMVVNRGREGSV